ncbi:hypothetical protein PP636_gp67 [Arthrobacter phage Hestia]|uniref:Holin n=1 Tax=Arthrobacter phage Hestia TaxID=2419609 RepID=A0A3G3M3D3_9CAUD|nr:hypothetical protein PP636_gp67 [Arthrobacter phage Hestia]AYR00906.1 hypothetical protein PBI_HESTIA_28 [Arthrobacter phage Hestia]
MTRVLTYTKAVAALLGAIVTALLGVLPADQYKWLVILGVVATAVATYAFPNQTPSPTVATNTSAPVDVSGEVELPPLDTPGPDHAA